MLPDRIGKLVDTINRVGIQNVSLLSRMTGIPVETVRYMIKKRFPDLGLFVGLHVDYDRLGLERNFAVLDFSPEFLDQAPEMLKKLSNVAFLTYQCRELVKPSYVAMFGVPVAQEGKFHLFLRRLVDEEILASFKLERLDWSRHPALRSEYYDYKKGEWSVDWSQVGALKESPPAPQITVEPAPRPDVDATDLLLIKELEIQSWRNFVDIARKLSVNDRTARWHYSKHVHHLVSSFFVHRLSAGSKDLKRLVGLIYEFDLLSRGELGKIRAIFNNFPFTWEEAGRRNEYYRAVLTVPSEHLIESLQFLTNHLQKIATKWFTRTLDLTTSRSYTIPYENFSDEIGWFFDETKALQTVLAALPRKKGRAAS